MEIHDSIMSVLSENLDVLRTLPFQVCWELTLLHSNDVTQKPPPTIRRWFWSRSWTEELSEIRSDLTALW